MCPPGQRHLYNGWDTAHVQTTCKVLAPEGPTQALGAPFGSPAALDEQVAAVLRKARGTRLALLEVGHAATELLLTRLCADVSKLSYQLRLNGDRVRSERLQAFDHDLREAVQLVAGGDLPDVAWAQCALGVKRGGLGMRTATQVSLAAFVASRVCSRPHVREMATHLTEQGLGDAGVIMAAYDSRTDEAAARLAFSLPPSIGGAVVTALEEAAGEAEARWAALFDPHAPTPPVGGRARRARPRGIGQSILPFDEDGDEEHPNAEPHSRQLHLR